MHVFARYWGWFRPTRFVRRCVSFFLASFAVSVAVVACGQESNATSRRPSEDGFQLVALTDLLYIPKRDQPSKKAAGKNKGKKGDFEPGSRRAGVGVIEVTDMFKVLRHDKGPEDGYFKVGGKPTVAVWKSSDSSILKITQERRSGEHHFFVLGSGKTTLSVSVGDWSDHTELTVTEAPIAVTERGVTRHELIEKFGYPSKKYWYTRRINDSPPPRGFTLVPQNCWNVGAGGRASRIGDGYFDSELWEFERWPRCLIRIADESAISIATRPAQEAAEHPPAKRKKR